MILSDREIREYLKSGKLIIKPIFEDTIRENGVDLRIGETIARLKDTNDVFDYKKSLDISSYYVLESGDSFILNPMEHILIHTIEYIKMPDDLVGLINLRSTYARLGLKIPPTVVDANFEGQLTIEIVGGSFPVKLYRGDRIIHVVLAKLTSRSEKAYKGKYLKQLGVTLPKFR